MTSLTKNPHIPTKKIFIESRLENLPHLLRLCTDLCHFWRQSYTRTKVHVIQLFWRENLPNHPYANVFMCLGMKNFVKIFVTNKQEREKLLRWRLYTSICTQRIGLNDAYMRQSAELCENFCYKQTRT